MTYRFLTPFSVLLTSALSIAPVLADEPLFRFQGMDYSSSDLSVEFQQNYYEQQADNYQKIKQLIDSAVLQLYFKELAKQKNQAVELVMEEVLGAPEPSEEELKKFYDENKERIPGEFDKVKPQLANYLKSQAIAVNKDALLTKIQNPDAFKLLVAEPEALPVTIASEGFPSRGAADAPVHIVEFADYQCPHCQKADAALKQVMQDYAGKVKLTYMDYPINRSGISRLMAEAAVCADQQGKYWQYHEQTFASQAELTMESPHKVAEQVGLDMTAFKACVEGQDAKQKVETAKNEGKRLALDSTPTIFINGKRVRLYDLNQDFRSAIDKALAETK